MSSVDVRVGTTARAQKTPNQVDEPVNPELAAIIARAMTYLSYVQPRRPRGPRQASRNPFTATPLDMRTRLGLNPARNNRKGCPPSQCSQTAQ